ncbi:hypothetical protein GH714_030882 [Hevea brasiliensis]|uniref:Uncharacterized protein n=1 Tax=Hevea brasiliensis TaxID=3981 RepID=A0A6A6LSL1_HEVBR|nr:hypothetical protein GH714_030882 [Hevea brasiliensis]
MSNVMDQSSVSAQTPVRSQDLLAELSSSAVASAGIVQSLEERHSRSLITPFQLSVNMSPGNGQLTNSERNDGGEGCSLDGRHLYCKRKTPKDEQLCARLVFALEAAPVMHQPSSVAASVLGAGARPSDIHQTIGVAGESQQSRRNIRLRRAPEDEQLEYIVEENDGGEGCSLNEYIVEENDGAEGFSLDGKHLYCKRRAPEDEQLGFADINYTVSHGLPEDSDLDEEIEDEMTEPSSVVASGLGVGAGPSNIPQTIGPSDIHQIIGVAREAQHSQRNILLRRVPADEQLGAGLVISLESAPVMHQPLSVAASGLGASAGPSDTHQTISEVGEAQHSQRTVNHQDFLPTNLATWTIRNSHPQLTAQLAIHLSFDCVPKTSSVTAIVQPTPPMQQPIPVSYFLESMQPFQWNDVTRSRTGIPFTSTYTLNGGDASLVEGNSRNSRNSKNGMLPSEFQRDLPMINYTVSHGLPKDSDLDEEIEDEMTEEIEELEELMIEYRHGLAGAVIEAHMKR